MGVLCSEAEGRGELVVELVDVLVERAVVQCPMCPAIDSISMETFSVYFGI